MMKQNIKEPVRFLLKAFFRLLYTTLGIVGVRGPGCAKDFIEVIEQKANCFITYHCRPVYVDSISDWSDTFNQNRSLAIVVQGPVITANDFTFETIKLYKKHFNGAEIILSTWDDTPPEVVKMFEAIGIHVLLNEQPKYRGQQNINLQIVSSASGVKKARELDAEFVLKTRVDQRIYAPDVGEFLVNLTNQFPPKGGSGLQKKRIIGLNLNTPKYRMYGLSDMLVFGHVDDMLLYWDAPLDDRVFTMEEMQRPATRREIAQRRICEVYLATEFLKKLGRDPLWTLRDSWSVFAEHFCIIDKDQLDLFWPKYFKNEFQAKTYAGPPSLSQEMCFRDWLNIYYNLEKMEIPEHLLDY